MPSWRSLRVSDKWFTASDLFDLRTEKHFDLDCEIVSVAQGEANQPGSDKMKKLPALTLRALRSGKELPKPLGLNATNGLTIESIVGSDDYKRWPGVLITLFVIPDARMGRERRPAIRIKPESPKPPQQQQQSSKPAQTSAPAPATTTAAGYQGDPPPMTDEEKREALRLEKEAGR